MNTKIRKPGKFRASTLPGEGKGGVWAKHGGKTRFDRETGSVKAAIM